MLSTKSLILPALAAGLLSVPAFAQSAPDTTAPNTTGPNTLGPDARSASSEDIDRITVFGERYSVDRYRAEDAISATKTLTPLENIPQSIQVLTGELLRDQDVRNLSEALSNVSGVAVADPSEGLLANFFIRGFTATVFFDGLPAFGQTNVVDPSSLAGVERIEVVKGPTGVLFGGGTGAPLGGLINVVTKAPQTERFAEIGLRGGSFGTVNPFWDINQPLLGDKLLLRVSGEYQTSDSFIDVVEQDRIAIFPVIAWRPAPETSVVLRGQYSRNRFIEYSGLPAIGTVEDAPFTIPRFRFPGASDVPENTNTNALVTAELRHRFTKAIEGNVSVRYLDSEFQEISTFQSPTFAAFFGLPTDPLDPVTPFFSGQLPTTTEQVNLNANLTGTWTMGPMTHQVLVGFEFDRTVNFAGIAFGFSDFLDLSDPNADIAFGPLPDVANGRQQDNLYRTTGGYIQDQITLWDRLHILLSGRITRLEVEERGLAQLDGTVGLTSQDTRFTPRAGAVLELMDGLNAFVGYGEGFQAVLNFLGEGLPVPEESRELEGGLKFALDDIGVSGTIAGYRIVRENVAVTDPSTLFSTIQAGEQRSVGAEVDVLWQPIEELSVLASYAYTDAINATEDISTGGLTIPEGARLARIPRHGGRVAVRWRVLDGPLSGLSVGMGVTAASPRELALPNTFQAPAFYVIDAQAGYTAGPVSLTLSLRNLTDREYFEPHSFLNQDVVRPAQPFAAFGTVSVRL